MTLHEILKLFPEIECYLKEDNSSYTLKDQNNLPDLSFTQITDLIHAQKNHLSFLTNENYISNLTSTEAGAVVITPSIYASLKDLTLGPKFLLVAKEATGICAIINQKLNPLTHAWEGISPQAFIHPTAQIDSSVKIFPFVFVGPGSKIAQGCVLYPGVYIGQNVTLEENCIVYANASIQDNCIIKAGCVLDPGCVIGGDGFGYALYKGTLEKIPQTGNVVLSNNVTVGSNSSINRGTFQSTSIGPGSKIDSLVQIAHNVSIGKNCLLAAQVGIAGSTTLGDHVTMAGQSGAIGHLNIKSHSTILAKSAATKDIGPGFFSGFPARDHRLWLKTEAWISRQIKNNKKDPS